MSSQYCFAFVGVATGRQNWREGSSDFDKIFHKLHTKFSTLQIGDKLHKKFELICKVNLVVMPFYCKTVSLRSINPTKIIETHFKGSET
jgi:hypothetical protein